MRTWLKASTDGILWNLHLSSSSKPWTLPLIADAADTSHVQQFNIYEFQFVLMNKQINKPELPHTVIYSN